MEQSTQRKSSTKYLENLKNMAVLKLKIRESINIFPKEHEKILNILNNTPNNDNVIKDL
jgi:hypothetical protein